MSATRRILVADDDDDLREMITFALKRAGVEVIGAANGTDALRMAREDRPDLILLDVMMPGIDGYHVAQQVSEAVPNPPKIVIMTSRNTRREEGVALMSGAAKVLQKPFPMKDLILVIDELLPAA